MRLTDCFEKVVRSMQAVTLFLCCLILGAVACKTDSRGQQKSVSVSPASSGACAFLSASDIQAVQGEAVSNTHGTERSNGPLITSQCFYTLPTFNKSVSLEIMRPNGTAESARATEEFWERRFHQSSEREREEAAERAAEREREKKRGGESKDRKEELEREKEETRPQPVPGLGDEAFWSGNQINGALYVRKDNVIVRLSIGGPEDQSSKLKKARALAEQVLKRL